MGALFAGDVGESIEPIAAVCTRMERWTSGRSRSTCGGGARRGQKLGEMRDKWVRRFEKERVKFERRR